MTSLAFYERSSVKVVRIQFLECQLLDETANFTWHFDYYEEVGYYRVAAGVVATTTTVTTNAFYSAIASSSIITKYYEKILKSADNKILPYF